MLMETMRLGHVTRAVGMCHPPIAARVHILAQLEYPNSTSVRGIKQYWFTVQCIVRQDMSTHTATTRPRVLFCCSMKYERMNTDGSEFEIDLVHTTSRNA